MRVSFLGIIKSPQILFFPVEMQSANRFSVVIVQEDTTITNAITHRHTRKIHYVVKDRFHSEERFPFFFGCNDQIIAFFVLIILDCI